MEKEDEQELCRQAGQGDSGTFFVGHLKDEMDCERDDESEIDRTGRRSRQRLDDDRRQCTRQVEGDNENKKRVRQEGERDTSPRSLRTTVGTVCF
jgi:hypothetical protein